MSFEIGKTARIFNLDMSNSRRGIIAYYHSDSGLYDIIYEDNKEENDVLQSRVFSLEDFEEKSFKKNILNESINPIDFKEYGNVLFSKKDYMESEKYYLRGLHKLICTSSSSFLSSLKDFKFGEQNIGSHVIIQKVVNAVMDFKIGMISDTSSDGKFIDVLYVNSYSINNSLTGNAIFIEDDNSCSNKNVSSDNDICDEDEENNISTANRVVAVLPSHHCVLDLELLRSFYLNLCRVKMKLKAHGWAIRYASLALIVTMFISYILKQKSEASSCQDSNEYSQKIIKQLADVYYLRGTSFLLAGRPMMAKNDCKKLNKFDSNKCHNLGVQIEQFLKRRHKSNKVLAIEMSKWVDSAMGTYNDLQKNKDAHIENMTIENITNDDNNDGCFLNETMTDKDKNKTAVSETTISTHNSDDQKGNISGTKVSDYRYQNNIFKLFPLLVTLIAVFLVLSNLSIVKSIRK